MKACMHRPDDAWLGKWLEECWRHWYWPASRGSRPPWCRCRGWPPSMAPWGADPRSSPGQTAQSASAWCQTAEAARWEERKRSHPLLFTTATQQWLKVQWSWLGWHFLFWGISLFGDSHPAWQHFTDRSHPTVFQVLESKGGRGVSADASHSTLWA